jgi:hypothetical protein
MSPRPCGRACKSAPPPREHLIDLEKDGFGRLFSCLNLRRTLTLVNPAAGQHQRHRFAATLGKLDPSPPHVNALLQHCRAIVRRGSAGSARVQVAAPAVTRSTLNMSIGAAPSSVGRERGSVSPRKMSCGVRVGFHITGQGYRPAPVTKQSFRGGVSTPSPSNSLLTGALQICNVRSDLPAGRQMMDQQNAEWYRARAAECSALAEKATDPRIKAFNQCRSR